jgi:cytochrome c-type biogenesis protein CcmH/NrfG
MFSGASLQRPSKSVGRRRALCRILRLIVLLISARGFAQQTTPSGGHARQSSKISPLLLEAEELLRQGSIDEAKNKIQEELQRNPSSVEGYNLLGIVFRNENDYANAWQAFQQALKLDAESTRHHRRKGRHWDYAAFVSKDSAEGAA